MSFFISRWRSRRSRHLARPVPPPARLAPAARLFGWFLGALMWLSVLVLVHRGQPNHPLNLAVGQVAPNSVLAEVPFAGPDLEQTQLNQRKAAETVPPVFAVNARSLTAATRSLEKLFYRVAQLRRAVEPGSPPGELESKLDDILYLLELPLEPAAVLALIPEKSEESMLGTITSALAAQWSEGIVSASDRKSRFQGIAARGSIQLQSAPDATPEPREVARLALPEEAVQAVVDRVGTANPDLKQLLQSWVTPNLEYNAHLTEELRAAARNNQPTVLRQVREGTPLLERGRQVTAQDLELLRAHDVRLGELETPAERNLRLLGQAGMLLLALFLASELLHILQPRLRGNRSALLILFLASLATLLSCQGLLFLSTSTRLIPPGLVQFISPLAIAPLLCAILLGPPTAIVVGWWTSFSAGILYGNSFSVFVLGIIATVIAARFGRDIHRRSTAFRAGLRVGFGWMVFVAALAALRQPPPATVASQAAAALLSGMACALLSLLLIPLFEYAFKVTTDITLLEHSDLGHPLLQRLALEAPGTYHHSLRVANLGQAAAADIGAHPLLVRVCAYFHDIGKLTKPEFFCENLQNQENPHDDLSPHMSALIVMAHVKEGVSLARTFKLPRPIVEAIQQHHGTGLIRYFYHRARRQAAEPGSGNREVNESDFRYEGPRPACREFGILLLADSVEAASRALSKPTPAKIENLVAEIVDLNVQDRQLDACDLTLAELAQIKRSFVFTLTSMLHSRIEYPPHESRNQQPPGKASGERAGSEEADPVAYEAGTAA